MACACISRVFCCPCNCCSATAKKCSFRSGGNGSVPPEEMGDTYFGAPAGLEMERKIPLLQASATIDATIETAAEAVTDNTDARIKAVECLAMNTNRDVHEMKIQLIEVETEQHKTSYQLKLNESRRPKIDAETQYRMGMELLAFKTREDQQRASEFTHFKSAVQPVQPVVVSPKPEPISEFEALFKINGKDDERLQAALTAPTFIEDAYEHYPNYKKKTEVAPVISEHGRGERSGKQMAEEKEQALESYLSRFKTQGCGLVVPKRRTMEESKRILASSVARTRINYTDQELLKIGLTRLDIQTATAEEQNKALYTDEGLVKHNIARTNDPYSGRVTPYTGEEIEQHRIARKAALEDPRTTEIQRKYMEQHPWGIIRPFDSVVI